MPGVATQRPFRDTDLMDFVFVGDPQLCPDGGRVAFTRTWIEKKENKYRSQICLVPFEGGPAVPFTGGPGRDGSPRWSPDGNWLAFVSDREAQKGKDDDDRDPLGPQIYVMSTRGGEARRITNVRGGVESFVWSPDSTRIAFVSRVSSKGPDFYDEHEDSGRGANGAPGGGASGASAADEPAEDEDEKLFRKFNRDVRVIDRILYRVNGLGYLEDKRAHVFVVDVREALAAVRRDPPRPIQVTRGEYDHASPAWSPDGRWIAVTACRAEDADHQDYEDVWVFPADGKGEPRKLTRSTGPVQAPSWSPDGRTVAYLGHNRELEWYSDTRLWLVPADGSAAPRCLTESFERSFGDESITDMRMSGGDPRPVWAPDGRTIYLPASDRGTTHLYAVDVQSGAVTRLTSGDVVLYGISVNPADRRFACAVAAPQFPGDIFAGEIPQEGLPALSDPTRPGGAELRRLTEVNGELLATREVAVPERFRFRAEGGPEVDGWAIRPLRAKGPKSPAVLEIHGGPMAMYTSTFFFEFQLLAAAGIGVIYTNPRGSQGYGQEFCAGIRLDWGKNDYADVMAGVDAAVRTFDWIDPDRLGVLGGSYGGYLTAWIIGHTNRFKAACVMRSVTNTASFFGTSDFGYQWDVIWGGTPWEHPENHRRQSPISYAGNMRTPTLILHAEQDYRCLIEQGEQLYAALKKQRVESVFVRYPDENHEMSRSGKPWHRVHRLRQIVAWFRERLKPELAGDPHGAAGAASGRGNAGGGHGQA
ncbi:MAG: S9 family peptidase [Clostridia bacterium]|nr:S9 family peptidase [Clostridia bacterium]